MGRPAATWAGSGSLFPLQILQGCSPPSAVGCRVVLHQEHWFQMVLDNHYLNLNHHMKPASWRSFIVCLHVLPTISRHPTKGKAEVCALLANFRHSFMRWLHPAGGGGGMGQLLSMFFPHKPKTQPEPWTLLRSCSQQPWDTVQEASACTVLSEPAQLNRGHFLLPDHSIRSDQWVQFGILRSSNTGPAHREVTRRC